MRIKPESVIEVSNVTKSFSIPLDKSSNLKSSLISTILNKKGGYRNFQALNKVSFTVNKGDFFGIVGRNGSGKSTLLKILAGIYRSDSGSVRIKGSLMPFIELGVGFNNKLTARENVYLNGAMIGFTRREVDAMYDDIVDFAELHDFMEEKLKNFSSGMKVRLAFSIAIRAPADILLLDEVIAVGDKAFRDKCNEFFKQQKGKRTIILVTHDMSAVEEFCNRGMLIEASKVVKIGDSTEIASLYNDMFAREKNQKLQKQNDKFQAQNIQKLSVEDVSILQNGKETAVVKAGVDFIVRVSLASPKTYSDAAVGIKMISSSGLPIFTASTRMKDKQIPLRKGKNTITFEIQNVFTDGNYKLQLTCKDGGVEDGLILLHESDAHRFSIEGVELYKSSLVHPAVKVRVN